MPRGGVRNGTPGKAYATRTDLGVAKLPAVAAPGQTYGVAGEQIAAQKQMPMAPQATPGAAQGEGAAPGVTPGSLGPLAGPTSRPDEPLTAGAPTGTGPNSLGLPSPAQQQYTNARDLIAGLAAASPSPTLNTLLAAIQAGQ